MGCAFGVHFHRSFGGSYSWEYNWSCVSGLFDICIPRNDQAANASTMDSLGAVYEAGNFRMSTWLPMIWGGVNVMVLIVTSFPMQGGL
jgi:hypothetical protein